MPKKLTDLNLCSEFTRIKILIKMSSVILSISLHELLRRKGKEYEIIADLGDSFNPDFEPHLILVDFSSLNYHLFLRWPSAKVILIDTGIEDSQLVSKLVYYKLHGIISTRTNLKLFRKALQEVLGGQIWIDNGKLKALIHNHDTITSMQPLESFSYKEKQIINLISQGFKNREIANSLAISEQTVKSHLNRIFRKGKITSRSQLLPLAMKLKIPTPI
jgi:DNA-binding NarL/FixJ family response regulator